MPSILALTHPSAGDRESAAGALDLLAADPRVVLVRTRDAQELRERAASAVAEGFERIIAAGGDGTLHAVVNAIMGAPCPPILGVVPVGTGNDTARSLGLSPDPEATVRRLLSPEALGARIDLIEARTAEGVVFGINTLTAGSSVRVLEETPVEAKARWGAWAYLRTALAVVADLETHRGWVAIDDEAPVEVELVALHVGNGRTSTGGVPSAPDAHPADGLLDLVIVAPGPVPALLGTAARHFLGLGEGDPRLTTRKVRRVRFALDPALRCRMDGEAVPAVEEIGLRPAALTVDVGPGFWER